MKILIVEDEPFAQQELIRLLQKTGREFELLDTLDSVEDSIAWFSKNIHPDLVFLDIQLADGLSFNIFDEIELKSAVIFTTAYDEFAIRAFDLNSIDYLLKPVKLQALETALKKYDKMKRDMSDGQTGFNEEQLQNVLKLMSSNNYKTRMLVSVGDQIKSIDIKDVAYFRADDNVVFVYTNDGSKYIVDYTLEQLEGLLDPQGFFRMNRTYIASISSIKKVSKYFNSRLLLELMPTTEEQVLVSRARAKAFLEWMDQ